MTTPSSVEVGPPSTADAAGRVRPLRAGLWAAVRATRPHQWPKNALVLAAPVAAGSWGPRAHGWLDCVAAGAAFVAASCAVYLVNDVVDVERDRRHPRKRLRPVASGALSEPMALAAAAAAVVAMLGAEAFVDATWFSAALTLYLVLSIFYSLGLKQVPVLEMGLVSSGFVLRGLGGAAATHIVPSVPFTVVTALGALVVVLEKRSSECADLKQAAAAHRPVLASYDLRTLRRAARASSVIVVAAYACWAATRSVVLAPHFPLLSVFPLGGALWTFHRRLAVHPDRSVEDVLTRDGTMIAWEVSWLALFALSAWP